MKKVLVIGCPDSGISTFARRLRDAVNLPLYHLDLLWHRPDRTTVSTEEFDAALAGILQRDRWIIDGNFSRTLERRLVECDTVYLLLSPSDKQGQQDILRQLLGKTGERFTVTAPFWCDYGYNIELGENFYSNHNLVILDAAEVRFGDNVFIAPNCGFYTARHPIDAERRNKGLEYAYPITVGDNVWIGGGVQVMPGVTIGSNVVIRGGSVVVKDIPDNSVAIGNPCRVIRPITEADRNTVWDR